MVENSWASTSGPEHLLSPGAPDFPGHRLSVLCARYEFLPVKRTSSPIRNVVLSTATWALWVPMHVAWHFITKHAGPTAEQDFEV